MYEKIAAIERNEAISSDDGMESADQSQIEGDDRGRGVEVLPPPSVIRIQPSLRRVTLNVSTSTFSGERVLPNGDLYTGNLLENVPHGTGKYLWADGCMYEGEWKRGKAAGKGRFSWPTGATYEGQFKSGRMDGYGTFTGSHGDTYRGLWVADKKHFHGEKFYANGDVYDGSWKNNLQDGEGKYVWRNGNVYIGEWKNGLISGKGVLIWANGNKYEGFWENGVPKGAGVFTRLDGSTYAGNWGELEEEQCEMFPARRRASIDEGRCSVSEKGVNFPRICIWEADEEAADLTRDIIDNVEASKLYRDARDSFSRSTFVSKKNSRPHWCGVDEIKKPGQMISKGYKNYELMLNLQLGIRHSVGKYALTLRELKPPDFEPREKFWTRFPPEGSKHTPPHQSVEFKWKDYCPLVFRHLRELFGIDPADYMSAICGSDALGEFSSPGKSGSFFYVTQDNRFMIKTVKKSEVKVLIRMLPSYCRHVSEFKNSLVTKFFGLHCIKPVGGPKTRFIIMGNLFHSEYRIHKRFDLKGSSYGRSIDKPEGEIDETTTLKDLDLNFVFHLRRSWFQELIRQVDRDCEFLEAERIMDYSLLIGLHFRDNCPSDEMILSPTAGLNAYQKRNSVREHHLFKAEPQDMNRIIEAQRPFIRLGADIPAMAERVSRIEHNQQRAGMRSNGTRRAGGGETFDVVLYVGIIDILQDYDISKKIEHAYKSLQVDPTSISAVDPKLYSRRFRDFMHSIFLEGD